MKTITLYRSAICPRCHMARKHLIGLQKQYGEFFIEEVDIMVNPLRTWQDGIRMIPALKIDDKILSGLYLGREAIEKFITEETRHQ